MADDTQVIEAEIVEEGGSGDAQLLMRLENMIRNHRTQIEQTRKELSEQREMLKDTFGNDPLYMEHDQAARAAAKIKNATKAQILKKPEAAALVGKVKNLASQLREYQSAISDYLREYQRVSGQSTFTGENGEVLEIVYVAKLRVVEKRKR